MAFEVDFEIGEMNFALQGGDESPHSKSRDPEATFQKLSTHRHARHQLHQTAFAEFAVGQFAD